MNATGHATSTAIEGCEISGEQADLETVTALYDAHVRDVYRYVHRLCLDRSIAEDVTQDVFVAALAEPITNLSVKWLMRSARNRMIDIVRRETNYRKKVRLLQRVDAYHDDVGVVIEQLRMEQALERLRTDHRIVLMLHHVDGVSIADLAEGLGRSYRGAEGLLVRARAALRAELENER